MSIGLVFIQLLTTLQGWLTISTNGNISLPCVLCLAEEFGEKEEDVDLTPIMLMTHLQSRLRQHFDRKHPRVEKKRRQFLRTRAAQLVCRRIHSNSTKFESDSDDERLKAQVSFFNTIYI